MGLQGWEKLVSTAPKRQMGVYFLMPARMEVQVWHNFVDTSSSTHGIQQTRRLRRGPDLPVGIAHHRRGHRSYLISQTGSPTRTRPGAPIDANTPTRA